HVWASARAVGALGTVLMTAPRIDDDLVWPALPYGDWQQTCTTLHMWAQVVGKVKLELTPFLNEWWNVAFAVTACGLTTAPSNGANRVQRRRRRASRTSWSSP